VKLGSQIFACCGAGKPGVSHATADFRVDGDSVTLLLGKKEAIPVGACGFKLRRPSSYPR